MRILAGDIGATKTLLQITEVLDHDCRLIHEQRFESGAYTDLGPMVKEFLGHPQVGRTAKIACACFGVAGPVKGQEARVTNLAWRLETGRLARETGIPQVRFINDFQAAGYGIEALGPDDLATLQRGKMEPYGPRVVIGAGTGLGEGLLVWNEGRGRYQCLPSEGGHVDFAPTDALQLELWRYLTQHFERATYERVLSGPGLVNIYHFLRDRGAAPASKALSQAMQAGDPAEAISRFALEGDDSLAAKALDLFVIIYGAQAGNLALTCLASGGVYIAGGIAPKILDRLKAGDFMEAFCNKGRMTRLLRSMPVHVILNPQVGLLGAALAATDLPKL